MKILIRFLSVFFLAFSLIGCDLEEDDPSGKPKSGYLDKMPEETSIGANTFGYYVNGKLEALQGWYQKKGIEPNIYGMGMGLVNGFLWKDEKGNYMMDIESNLKFTFFWIKIREYPSVGKKDAYFAIDKKDADIDYGGFNTIIDITKFDTIEHVISGRFNNLKMSSIPNSFLIKDTLYIINGQFDIKYGQNF